METGVKLLNKILANKNPAKQTNCGATHKGKQNKTIPKSKYWTNDEKENGHKITEVNPYKQKTDSPKMGPVMGDIDINIIYHTTIGKICSIDTKKKLWIWWR